MKKTYIMIAVFVMVSVAAGMALASMGGKFLNPERYQAMIEKKAEMFGMAVEEVNTRLEQGETLKEIFAWNGEDMMANKEAWMQEKINAMVAEGKITQEQADEKLAAMQEGWGDCPEECKKCGGHWKGKMDWGRMKQFHK